MDEPNLNVEKTYTDPKTGKFLPGNPGGGRPKGSISLLSDLKRRLKDLAEKDPQKYEELIDDYWQDKSKREFLMKMIDGMPKQSTELTGKDGEQLAPLIIIKNGSKTE